MNWFREWALTLVIFLPGRSTAIAVSCWRSVADWHLQNVCTPVVAGAAHMTMHRVSTNRVRTNINNATIKHKFPPDIISDSIS